MAQHNDLGRWGEDVAVEYLEKKGWYIRHRDWQYQHKDLDIVAIDEDMTTLLIVEVKTRSSEEYGSPDMAVDNEKKHNIITATASYIRQHHLEHLCLRYDVINIIGTPDTSYTIEHKENSFDVTAQFYYYEERRKRLRYGTKPGQWKVPRWGR